MLWTAINCITIYAATFFHTKKLLLKFGKCYHFVIIVIDNISTRECTIWCLFLSFFLRQKMTFFPPLFFVTIMLSELHGFIHKLILLYFEMTLHKTRKIPEKMDKNRCPKMRSTKHFWENSTRTRCFAELFGTHTHQTINAVAIWKLWV